jgi:hypothetical protein
MAHTRKPCPGCGEIDRYRAADEVCHTCRDKLKRIAAIEAEAEQLRATVANTLAVETKPRGLYLPEKGYGIAGSNVLCDSEEYNAFAVATAAMIRALTAPLDRDRIDNWGNNGTLPAQNEYHRRDTHESCIETTDEAARASQDWWRAFKTYAHALYGAGVEDGRDLLGQLAAGEMTVTQVNDRAYEMVNRKRRY